MYETFPMNLSIMVKYLEYTNTRDVTTFHHNHLIFWTFQCFIITFCPLMCYEYNDVSSRYSEAVEITFQQEKPF